MTENDMIILKRDLFDNTFGCIVDIVGSIDKLIMIANNPMSYMNLAKQNFSTNNSTIMGTFSKGSNGSELRYEIDEDSAFAVIPKERIFIQDKILTIKSKDGYSYISECVLCFSHMMGLTGQRDVNGTFIVPSAIELVKKFWDLEIKDLTGTIVQYEGFDDLIKGYKDSKNKPRLNM